MYILTAYIISASQDFVWSLKFHHAFYSLGRASCFVSSAFKFPGFDSIIVILPAFRCRTFLSLWVTVNQHQPFFFSMAELPAPPAPVVPVVVAEEPAASVVPTDAELEWPPVVEPEVFSLNCFLFSCSTCFGPSVFIVSSLGFPYLCAFIFCGFRVFPCSSQIWYSQLCLLFCMLLFCFLPCPFCASCSFIAVCICCALCIYFWGILLRFLFVSEEIPLL